MRRTASYFIPSAMTRFIAYVFLYPNRVSLTEAFEVPEPDDGKLSRPVRFLEGRASVMRSGYSIKSDSLTTLWRMFGCPLSKAG